MTLRIGMRAWVLAVPCLGVAAVSAGGQQAALSAVLPNDNHRVAGTSDGVTTTIQLVAGRGQWRPEENEGPALDITAFAL